MKQHNEMTQANGPMTHHCPDSQWLTEYAAGTLSDSQALCVSTHLGFCDTCSEEVARLSDVGAMVFENQPPSASVDPAMFEQIMNRIENRQPVTGLDNHLGEQFLPAKTASPDQSQTQPGGPSKRLPAAIAKLVPGSIDNLRWKKLGKYIRVASLDRLDEHRDISLHKLMPGGTVAEHDHRGQEVTVVLCGSFSDQDGVYKAGDFIVRQPGDTHTPTVTEDEECICLAVCDAPVKFTGVFTRLLNPIVAYQHKH